MIIDCIGKKGINYFGRRYEFVLGHNIERTFFESLKWFIKFDVLYNFILGITWEHNKKGELIIKKYNPFKIKHIVNHLAHCVSSFKSWWANS
jgi:hypothetical protein